jgi:hypothetical protein
VHDSEDTIVTEHRLVIYEMLDRGASLGAAACDERLDAS